MDKIKKYIEVTIPMHACTLRCSYCYLSQSKHDFSGGLPHFDFNAKFFRSALSINRLGGVARINFCGDGETLLVPHLVDYIWELLDEGHWVDIVTNGTVTRVMYQLSKLESSYRERIFMKISLHYLELKKRNLLDAFFANIRIIRDAGISFSVLLTGSDEYIPYIEEIKEICLREVGALPHISIARNDDKPYSPLQSKYSRQEYREIWNQFDSQLFNFQDKIFSEKRKEFCMGGAWTFSLNMETGELRQCHIGVISQNIYEDISKPIKLIPIGHFCRTPFCTCGPIWLTLGTIPEMQTPSYAAMRNRTCVDGTEWLSDAQKECMSHTLSDYNQKYSFIKRVEVDFHMARIIYWKKLCRKWNKLFGER